MTANCPKYSAHRARAPGTNAFIIIFAAIKCETMQNAKLFRSFGKSALALEIQSYCRRHGPNISILSCYCADTKPTVSVEWKQPRLPFTCIYAKRSFLYPKETRVMRLLHSHTYSWHRISASWVTRRPNPLYRTSR